jgi:hypothetical protein
MAVSRTVSSETGTGRVGPGAPNGLGEGERVLDGAGGGRRAAGRDGQDFDPFRIPFGKVLDDGGRPEGEWRT